MQRRLKSKRNHEYSADELVGLKGSRFVACQRLNYGEHNEQELVAKSRYYIEKLGVPVVISDVPIGKGALEPDFFTLEWLCRHYPDQEVPIILPNRERAEWTWDKFSNHVMRISNSKTRGPKRRAYAHDVDCPKEWDEAVKRMIPDYYHYMGPSDLMRFLPDKLRAKNLMTYVGMGQTQTPGHVDMCGTMGHNLMVYSVQGASALWFMVARDDKQKAAKFWHAETGGNANLESESCFMDIDKLCRADFNIYVLEQKVGDFVLLPSDTVHQVINRGDGYNVKVSWNRSSCHNMPYTFNRMLPRLRKIFKVEAYRCKAMAHKAMEGYADAIENAMPDMNAMQAVSRKLGAPDRAALAKDFGTLIKCVVDNLATEWISENGNSVALAEALNMLDSAQEGGPRDECVGINISKDPMPFERRCNFCNCDIWNRRFHCPLCVPEECEQANIASESLDKEPGSGRDQGEAQEAAALLLETDDGEDLCIACYAYGRTCQEHPNTMLIFESFDMRSMLGLCARAVGIYRKLYESLDPQSKLETANLTEEK
ncbi:hypothetical protein EV182_004254 [Spiromyces aspiralis]|uniref:Uncharacterized protein n=1 Tax=Spiromyces aspiralis TaxID=68401 RepID=A0ACC1HCP8_9FUNG|nr:hypothetical protein EV182_004254 [Spiromyces aspiralis]